MSPFDDFPIHPSADPIAHPASMRVRVRNWKRFAKSPCGTDRKLPRSKVRLRKDRYIHTMKIYQTMTQCLNKEKEEDMRESPRIKDSHKEKIRDGMP